VELQPLARTARAAFIKSSPVPHGYSILKNALISVIKQNNSFSAFPFDSTGFYAYVQYRCRPYAGLTGLWK